MFDTQTLTSVTDLADDEAQLLGRLGKRIDSRYEGNRARDLIYQAKQRVKNLGIALPPQMERIRTVIGWPGTVVDVLEERLELEDFLATGADLDQLGLREVWAANHMAVEQSSVHLDSLIFGLNFVAVSDGDDVKDEPHPLITVEPPTRMTAEYDARTRRLSAAAGVTRNDNGEVTGATLYLPDVDIILTKDSSGAWTVVDRQEHGLGRVRVVRFVNRPRGGRAWGTSEISRAVISTTDMAVRTLLGMEVAREFYSSPQRYLLGADEKAFQRADGTMKTAWEAYLGRILAIPASADGDKLPQAGQFQASSPEPYLGQIRGLAQLLAAEGAIPAAYLGFHTDNPASADAIRAGEARLIKRSERRQTGFGGSWIDVADICLQIANGGQRIPNLGLAPVWRDAATPTKAAQADAVVKLVSAGILPPDSEVTYDLLGLSAANKQRLLADARARRAASSLHALTGTPDPAAVKAQADALGALIRAGVEPIDAARQVGLDVAFTGAVPVSLRLPEADAADLEEA